jgi:cell division protein FtsW (lipid II flippase)
LNNPTPQNEQIQGRLIFLAALFLFLYSITLSLSPAGTARTWEVTFRWSHWLGYFIWLLMIILAHYQMSRRLPEHDPYLLPIGGLLSGWGTLTIWRLFPSFGLRQSIWLMVVLGVFILGLSLPSDLGFLRRYKYLWLSSGLLLTALTLIFGTNPIGYGPRMWLGCCGVYFQPSEPLKLLLIIYLSAYLADRLPYYQSTLPAMSTRHALLPLLAPTLVMIGLVILLLLAQRDLGTAVIFLFLYTVIIYVASGKVRILLASGLTLVLAIITGYALFDVVRLRIDAWLNPWIDPSNRSYQIVQSLIAIANGGILGRGPGLGSPGLVPVAHSDFIFASISEESGLVGGIGLLLVLALLVSRGMRITFRASDAFQRYLAAGLTAFLTAQSILIIGGNLRLLPLTGVTLPFVSYGGSSLLTAFLSLLLLLHISNQAQEIPTTTQRETQPYVQLAGLLLAGLIGAAIALGWWTIYRGPVLINRTDNPRRSLADRYVPRGSIVDRHNEPIAATTGQPGTYTRQLRYPPLSPIIGYTDSFYGQAGLEGSLDPYLRGLQGYPSLVIWWNHLLYGQPPPGLDVRLVLDMGIQRSADQALDDHTGALVVINAKTGDILALASHPYFDANHLQDNWDNITQDPQAPLLDRPVQGRYPVGDLLTKLFPQGASTAGLDSIPLIHLPASEPSATQNPAFSPLQIALAAASLSNGGVKPAPVLVQAVKLPQGWVLLPVEQKDQQIVSEADATNAVTTLAVEDHSLWQNVAVVENGQAKPVTWYVGGSPPGWKGTPLAVAVLLEEDNPDMATGIGQGVLKAAMTP